MAASKINLNYGQGAGDFEGGHFFGKSPMGGTYFWRKILRLSGKNKTKNVFFENIFLGGHFFSARKIKLLTSSPKTPPAINNEPSLRVS